MLKRVRCSKVDSLSCTDVKYRLLYEVRQLYPTVYTAYMHLFDDFRVLDKMVSRQVMLWCGLSNRTWCTLSTELTDKDKRELSAIRDAGGLCCILRISRRGDFFDVVELEFNN